MIPVLSREGESLIDRVAAERALLVFDFDGTLAPIVADRGHAAMRPTTRALLRVASTVYSCVVISGRSRSDLARRLGDVPLLAIVGSHGAELDGEPAERRLAVRARAWAGALHAALARIPGVDIEEKGVSVAVHHRHADPAACDGARIAALAASLPGARVVAGESAVDVLPVEARTRGGAVEALAEREHAPTVLYMGGDATSEDAFLSSAVTFPVRVGRTARTAARYVLEDQAHVDDLLRELLVARSRHAQLGDAWKDAVSGFEPGGNG